MIQAVVLCVLAYCGVSLVAGLAALALGALADYRARKAWRQ